MEHIGLSKHILFIGEFPPPYGGVTVKDSLIVEEILSGNFELELFNLYRFKFEKVKLPLLFIQMVGAIKRADKICIGVGHPFRTCVIFRIAQMLHGKEYLKNITDFMMGISTPKYLQKHPRYIPLLASGAVIYAESDTLVKELNELGCMNAKYLPNFRKGDQACEPRPVGEKVRFVYFAQVRHEKGFDTLVQAALKLNKEGLEDKFDVTVYGSIIDGYQEEFEQLLNQVPNMQYKGTFDVVNNNVYAELNQYDSSSSSSWREGMSGTNIECKFAGIANIVSNAGFNPECVKDGVEGILVEPRSVDSLAGAMRSVIEDHELLMHLKQGSYDSRVEYDVATWKEEVLDVINGLDAVNRKTNEG
jgi:glycosyltransferase involved in cell wall biosynthesis